RWRHRPLSTDRPRTRRSARRRKDEHHRGRDPHRSADRDRPGGSAGLDDTRRPGGADAARCRVTRRRRAPRDDRRTRRAQGRRTDQQTATDRAGALGWTTRGDLAALTRPGAGSPVVVVHGVMADAEAWRRVAEAIAPERPVLVPNRRGRRPGPGTGVGYGLDREVADLTAWLHGLGEPADEIGRAYGGLVALGAVRRGAPARSLVLYEPVARP